MEWAPHPINNYGPHMLRVVWRKITLGGGIVGTLLTERFMRRLQLARLII
tara:strand:- start:41607 stop:41756 length:150 start_codon:yes stop_codon:yes gene_type:complete